MVSKTSERSSKGRKRNKNVNEGKQMDFHCWKKSYVSTLAMMIAAVRGRYCFGGAQKVEELFCLQSWKEISFSHICGFVKTSKSRVFKATWEKREQLARVGPLMTEVTQGNRSSALCRKRVKVTGIDKAFKDHFKEKKKVCSQYFASLELSKEVWTVSSGRTVCVSR